MARISKDTPLDLTQTVDLSGAVIDRLTCPTGKAQAFLRDGKTPGLRVRVTAAGAKAFVFEARLKNGQGTLRRTIGDVRTWRIEEARIEARRLGRMLDDGLDPREVERQQLAEKAASKAAKAARAMTVGELWPVYLETGKPKRRDAWKPRYRSDLEALASPGGKKKKRGKGLTRPGPLHPLMSLPLASIDEDALKGWYDREAEAGKHQAARALMMFRGFLRWCAGRVEYRGLVDRDAGKGASILESLPRNVRRTDCIEADQLADWWTSVTELENKTASVYLRALLLTGARRTEMAALKWKDVDFRWRKLTLADKVEDTRTIPLTPYLASILQSLPRGGSEYVFASNSKSGHITDARPTLDKASANAGIEKLTIHGLRRTYSLLGEAAGAPAGALAQGMGHKPSAVAEGYRPRSIDALRPYLEKAEAYILETAGVEFVPQAAAPRKLRAVS